MTTAKPKRIRKPKINAKHHDARPTIYHDYWGQKIADHMAQGWSLYRFCQKPENPTYSTVLKWQRDIEDFRNKLARARDEGAEAHVDRMGYIQEQVELGLMDPIAGRVAIQARKDIAGMVKPKKYGPRIHHEGSGPDGAMHFHITKGDVDLG